MSELFDESEVRKALAILVPPGGVWEVRATGAKLPGSYRPGIVSGYFDSIDACIAELKKLVSAEGIYITMNLVDPALLARRRNRLDNVGKDSTTGDQHVLELLNFLIDVDFDRPKGVSTTDEEKELTRLKVRKVCAFLKEFGFPPPVVGDSGNGHHLNYRIKLPCTKEELVKAALGALADHFDDGKVKIDRAVFNPSRIIKLYGTWARKGDNTPSRPHRLSEILDVPKSLELLNAELLQALVDKLQPERPASSKASKASAAWEVSDVEAFFAKHSIAYKERQTISDGRDMWLLDECPFNPDHNGTEVAVFRWPSGMLGFQCKHSSDVGKGWKEFRRHFEPDYDYGKAEFARAPKAKAAGEQGEPALPPEKSAATRLVKLAEGFEFFHDQQDRPFVRLDENGHTEVWQVESSKFRKLLARMFYKHTGNTINRNAVGDAITTLAGKASYDGSEEPVFLRVAPHGENILIDLCDAEWRVVEVTPEGWRILDRSPVAFIRTGSMQALPLPVQGGGSIAPLWKLLNVSEAQRPLVAGSLLNALHPGGPYFVTNYVGEHGAAKSCAARIERQLVDPNSNPLRSPAKEERDLISQAASNWVVAMDNLSYLQSWLSDAICRLATGGGHSARTLYTDLEEISLSVKRPVFLNGIEDVAVRPDLADRALQIELEQIPKENRMPEEDLWPELEKQRTTIFTAILDALSCALKNRPEVKKKYRYLPRMADAAIWVTAGETSFGFERGTFLKAYAKNLDESAAAAIELNPVGLAITQLLEKQDEWSGTPTELLEALATLVSDEQKRKKSWPENVRALGHALRRLAPALRRAGFDYQRPPRSDARRIIVLVKKRKNEKTTSETSETSVTEEEPESATSSENVTESATSSVNPLATDDTDDTDVLFPTFSVSTSGSDHQGLDEAPPGPASVPATTITQEMASELRALGYSQPAICQMTPGEAHRILSGSPKSDPVKGNLSL